MKAIVYVGISRKNGILTETGDEKINPPKILTVSRKWKCVYGINVLKKDGSDFFEAHVSESK